MGRKKKSAVVSRLDPRLILEPRESRLPRFRCTKGHEYTGVFVMLTGHPGGPLGNPSRTGGYACPECVKEFEATMGIPQYVGEVVFGKGGNE